MDRSPNREWALAGFRPGSGETWMPPPHKAAGLLTPASSSSPPQAWLRSGRTSGSLQAPDVRLLLQPAPRAVRGSLPTPLHRHRQPSPRGPDRGCLQGHGLPRRALRHLRLPAWAATTRHRQQEGVGEDEGRVCRAPHRRIYPSAP